MADIKPQPRHPLAPAATALVLLALFALPQFVRNEYLLHLCIVSAIFVIIALGLNLIVGYVGQLSLAEIQQVRHQ